MANEQILVVEDETISADLLQAVLRELGYVVPKVAVSGEEAIEQASLIRPNLVLMDIRLMGGMDGVEAAQQIRTRFDIPIVYVTGASDDVQMKQAKATEPYGYLVKPVHSRELYATIEMALYKHEMDRKLKESEKRYRAVMAQALDAIFLFDMETKHILEVNPAFERLLGYASHEIDDLSLYNIVAHDRESIDSNIRKIVSKEQYTVGEWRYRRKDGSLVEVMVNCSSITSGGREVGCIILHDITERKQMEEKLKEQEERLRLALYGSDDGLWDWNIATGEFYFSPRCTEMLGYAPNELESHIRTWERLIHPDDLPETGRLLKEHLKGHIPIYESTHRVPTKSGEWKWVTDRGKVVERNKDGKALRIVGTRRDITDQKKLEQMLFQAKEEWERTFDAVVDSINVIGTDYRILRSNKTAARLAGMRKRNLIGLPCYRLYHSSQTIPDGCPHTRLLEDGCEHTVEMYNEKLDRHLLITASPIYGPDNKLAGAVHVARDITKRKQFESHMRQVQKLESLGIVAGGIAHDFNNLLMVIIGLADLTLTTLPRESGSYRHLEQIRATAWRMANVSKQMLTYTGKIPMEVQPVDLSDTVEQMTSLLEASLSKKTEVRYDLTRSLPNIEADPGQIRQIIMNLVVNASEAIDDRGGIITVTTGVMECDNDYLKETYVDDNLPPGSYVYLRVSDGGYGMDSAILDKIFDPFFTTKFTGRGLGLATVLGIIRAHRGAIKAESRPGQGAVFTALFPAFEAKAAESMVAVETSWTSGGTILVVDDEEQVRSVARQMLEWHGFKVITAPDGREGVETFICHADEIDVVLLDLSMPRLSGEQAIQEIKRVNGDVPVILSSGFSQEAVLARFGDLKPTAFIQKPYSVRILVEKVREILRSLKESP